MRKTLTLLFLLVFALGSTGFLLSQANEEEKKFQKAVDNYLDALWKFYPTAATLAGYHKYDNQLEDLSKRNIEKRHDELDALNQEFVAKVDRFKLPAELQIDHEIMVDALDFELIKHENLVPWSYNPLFYNDIVNHSIRSLMTGTFGTSDERAKNATERLKALPKLLSQAKDSLQTPPQIHTETAIRQFEGILEWYRTELPQLIEQFPQAQRNGLSDGLTKALPALQDYQSFLKNTLLPKSTGNFRLQETHTRVLRILLQNEIPLQDLIARAKADESNIRRAMLLICAPFYQIMDPKFDLNNPPSNLTEEQYINSVVSHVMDRMKDDHAAKEDFLPQLQEQKDGIKQWIEKNQFIDLPVDQDVKIIPMPREDQGYKFTRLLRPGAYDPRGEYAVKFSLLTDEFTEEGIQMILEEYNNYLVPFFVIRKILPGEFVPFYFANKNSTSLVRKLNPSIPLIQGWPVFLEDSFIKSGFGDYDLRLRLHQLKYRLKTAMDLLTELNIHQGGMTKDQAIAYLTRMGFQTQAEAERNWNRICLYPGDATYAYVGLQELTDMEKIYKEKKGGSYSLKEFSSKVLSYGNFPLRHLKKRIAE